tara:strand:+ start:77 stop:544 length:468 start_codon:yes stop_codon:yes gene_type:complete
MNERQFIVIKKNEGKSFKQIADCLNVMNNKNYTSQEIEKLYKHELRLKRKHTLKLTPQEEIKVNMLKHEFADFLEVVGEQYRTVNWAVKSINGDRNYSCSCGSLFLRDILCKKGGKHFAKRKCMGVIINPFDRTVQACNKHIKWLSSEQVEYPKQ